MHGMRGASSAGSGPALDLLAFAIGAGCAWFLGWNTTDLVWSLWLSSLVVGWVALVLGVARLPAPAGLVAKVGLVGFFTVHFGLFHFVHAVFLNAFFPVPLAHQVGADGSLVVDAYRRFFPGPDGIASVFANYWPWLIAAAIAERAALLGAPRARARPASGEAPAASAPGADLMQPYKNVIRMHLLIFFFVGAWLLGLQGAAVWLVVYAVYFLPWRRLLPAPRATATG